MKSLGKRYCLIPLLTLSTQLVLLAAPNHYRHIKPDPAIKRYKIPKQIEPHLSTTSEITLLRKKVKIVFVIYQENRSFDSLFGTFPGADGIYSHLASNTPGFFEKIVDTDGSTSLIHPFRMDPSIYSADLDDCNHAHSSILYKMDVKNGIPEMNRFALGEEKRFYKSGNPPLMAKQYGELSMGYIDGDTIPFLWRYANRFVLADHIFSDITGPSTPGNLAIIAAQTGATQWMLHPEDAFTKLKHGKGVPVVDDAEPYWGSSVDTTETGKMPYNSGSLPQNHPQLNLTFATLPLSLQGLQAKAVTSHDRDPKFDLGDVEQDVSYLTKHGTQRVPWGWYQEAYSDKSPDMNAGPVDATGTHAGYVTHHNGPQYFGYIANNPSMSKNLHGFRNLRNAIDKGTLPTHGIFYIKGGYLNQMGLKPECPDPRAQKNFLGDDDHPGYSDSRISESMIADTINRIAKSKYWSHCAIIITWDDSEGDYDNVRPPLVTIGPDGKRLANGCRVPFLLISPYSKTHFVDHQIGSQASVVSFADLLFGLTPLENLPDEQKGIRIGDRMGLKNEGPTDASPLVTNLLSAFDPARLVGKAAPLPASYVMIPESLVRTQPADLHYGLKQIGVEPTDYALGIKNDIPKDFNPRPSTTPTSK